MKGLMVAGAVLSVVGLTDAANAAPPTPVVEYQFNSQTGNVTPVSPGTQAAGNATAPNLSIFGDDGVTPSTTRIGGVGPSGQLSDTVLLKATTSTSKAIAKFIGDIPQLDNLKSYTVTFWVNGAVVSAGSDRTYVYGGADGGAIGAIETEMNPSASAGSMNIKISNAAQNPGGVYTNNQWSFVAITYDGSAGAAATNNLLAYAGSPTSFNSTPVSTLTNTTGTLPAPTVQQLLVGNRADGTRGLGFLLDDLTIFGSKTDASGVLSPADLQAVYNNGLTNTSSAPEPTAIGLAGLGMLLMTRRRRRA